MTKLDLIVAVAERAGTSQRQAASAAAALLGAVPEALARAEAVRLAGFGAFAVRERAAQTAKNPRTGEAVQVPAGKRVVFRPAPALRAAAAGK